MTNGKKPSSERVRNSIGPLRNASRTTAKPTAFSGKRGPAAPPVSPNREIVAQLTEHAHRLKMIFGTAVTAELALRNLNCEHDVEVADGLRAGVCDRLADQARLIVAVIKRLGGHAPEPF